ncbi:MAG: Ig-like domain-containing protein, partial [Planctomycetota bacterium]|nr:Ig-like domain-containing protein [Planctomycetota bacterium]
MKVVVDASSGDDMVFGYDSIFHRSHLIVGMTTSNGDPVLTMGGSPLNYTEGDGVRLVDGGISLTDDDANQQWATIQITSNFQSAQDRLTFTDPLPGGISMQADIATGQIVFYGASSFSSYETVLKNVKYENVSEDPSELVRTVTYQVYDGQNLTVGTQTINVTAVNDAPTVNPTASGTGLEDQNLVYTHAQMLSLIGANDVDDTNANLTVNITGVNNATFNKTGSGNGTTYTFTLTQPAHANGYAVTFSYEVVDPDLAANSGGPATITIQAVNDEPGLTIGSDQNVNEDTGLHTVSGFASATPGGGPDESGQTFTYIVNSNNGALFAVAPAIDASGNLTYTLAADAFGTATVTVSVRDSGGTANGGDDTSPSQQFAITVANSNNDDAFVAVNNGLSIDENATKAITAAMLRVDDVDFPAASSLTYTVTSGTTLGQLELTTAPTVAITSFTQDDINTGKLVYVHFGAEAPLTDSFIFTVTDGIGSPTASQTFNITIAARNDTPVNTTPAAQNTPQNTPLVFSTGNGNVVAISDDDAGGSNVEVTLNVTNGTVTLDLPVSTATPVGAETVVNTTLGQTQAEAVVAVRDSGDYVVAWSGKGGGGESDGVWIQLFNASGTPDPGGNIRVNTQTIDVQSDPAIAMDNAGNFVVVWTSLNQDGDIAGVYGQRFDSVGNTVGSEFQVNTIWTSAQRSASVAMDADGDFVVVWEDKDLDGQNEGIFAQRYNSLGVAQGAQLQVNTNWPGKQSSPEVAMDAAGNFVVAWTDNWLDGHNEGVFAQRFDKDGNPLGSEFQVNTQWSKKQHDADIAMNAVGEFVIVWTSEQQDGGSNSGVYGQRYDAAGNTVGGEFLINSTIANHQEN